MGAGKPQAVKAPFQQQQTQTNTYAPFSIAGTPEAKSFLEAPLDFGDPVNVDPGVGRRADLAEEEVADRYESSFMSGVPAYIRNANRAKEVRDVRGNAAYERQQADFMNQQANNLLREKASMADLERRRLLLPQILNTGGSGSSSGFNTQVTQPQPGFLSSLARGIGAGAAGAATTAFL
jgi:hypothetical protein